MGKPPELEFVDASGKVVKRLVLTSLSEAQIKSVLTEHGFVRKPEQIEAALRKRAEDLEKAAKQREIAKVEMKKRMEEYQKRKNMPRILPVK
mmetsp:Transcript_3464/g.7504  ORF Transcript_3464/g.7504 Transcript_3464/m.7504 type:complete len:92 (+) Transcript_3464:389-664(+)